MFRANGVTQGGGAGGEETRSVPASFYPEDTKLMQKYIIKIKFKCLKLIFDFSVKPNTWLGKFEDSFNNGPCFSLRYIFKNYFILTADFKVNLFIISWNHF